ncbi:MAG: hypothetical protein ACLTS6_07050 [Anaerobutyricum sp.]
MEKKVYEVYCNSCGKKIETTDSTKREDYISIKRNGDISQIKMDKYIYFIYVSPVMIHGQGSFGFR